MSFGADEVHDSLRSYNQPDELEPNPPTIIPDPTAQPQQLFRIEVVPNKGRGLIASCDIPEGTRILSESPLFTLRSIQPGSELEAKFAKILKTLSKSEQRQYLSLHNNSPGKFPFSGIFKTNALPCGPGSPTGGIYPTISLINHSCLPNTYHCWNSNIECETIHATQLIKSGEEITIAYAQNDFSESRKIHLKNAFGFDCDCALCSLPPREIRVSDARRTQINILDNAIGNGNMVMNKPEDCLATCFKLLQLLNDEYHGIAPGLVARLYDDAFQISITHGDQARAKIFAQRQLKLRILCEGEDSPEMARIDKLISNPASHLNFGISRRWKRAKSMVPKGLSPDEFEEWLWKGGT
ncbi:hypothetical protein ABW20_dc0100574 [Dactylellina cionopaga]|nr:hypothetical protein ABW20_dc0100574 [Dactylellina cionopaga]